ncbi:tetratricopeptide repeat protein [[Pantoea] beijingensis]|nr:MULTISPECIES: tight adherance operon protein [Erwiniaceae]
MDFFKKTLLFITCMVFLAACQSPNYKNPAQQSEQEDILLKSQNYTGLINLYRGYLKEKDDPAVRLKLCQYYYLAGDYKSSLYYLQPLSTKADINVYTLQARNMISLGDYKQAVRVTDRMLQASPQSAEAYNLRGIALALSGDLAGGGNAIQKSREFFIADDVAINNLAMVALLDQRYQDAVGLLLPSYLRGRKQPRLLHNLVLALVKSGDSRYAKDIIRNEKLSDYPDEVVESLGYVDTLKLGGA